MLVGIDHVVLATPDPDLAAADLERRLGLGVGGGGRHDADGTFNRLIWLGDSFLELAGVFDDALAARSWFGRSVASSLERGGGLVTWVVAVDDVDAALRWGPPEGGLLGPSAGERRRPDGRIVRWRVARPTAPSRIEPFVIEHDLESAEWTPSERATRADERHQLGGRVRLAGLEVVAASPPIAAGRLRTLLGVNAEPAGRRAVRVRIGAQEVRLVLERSGSPAVVELITDVAQRTRVARIGDCDIRLRGITVTTARSVDAPAPAADGGASPTVDGGGPPSV